MRRGGREEGEGRVSVDEVVECATTVLRVPTTLRESFLSSPSFTSRPSEPSLTSRTFSPNDLTHTHEHAFILPPRLHSLILLNHTRPLHLHPKIWSSGRLFPRWPMPWPRRASSFSRRRRPGPGFALPTRPPSALLPLLLLLLLLPLLLPLSLLRRAAGAKSLPPATIQRRCPSKCGC